MGKRCGLWQRAAAPGWFTPSKAHAFYTPHQRNMHTSMGHALAAVLRAWLWPGLRARRHHVSGSQCSCVEQRPAVTDLHVIPADADGVEARQVARAVGKDVACMRAQA